MESPTVLKLFLIAENRLLREALGKLLGEKEDICIVGATSLAPEVLEQITARKADVVLMGPGSFNSAGPEYVQEINRRMPGMKVILMAMDADEQMFLRSVRAGAVGYVLKDASVAELEAAIRAACRGEAVCPARLCSFLFMYISRHTTQFSQLSSKEAADLSRRERQLVPLIANGLTNKEIASQLCISEQTVKNHIHRMLRKFGTDNRLKLAEMMA